MREEGEFAVGLFDAGVGDGLALGFEAEDVVEVCGAAAPDAEDSVFLLGGVGAVAGAVVVGAVGGAVRLGVCAGGFGGHGCSREAGVEEGLGRIERVMEWLEVGGWRPEGFVYG